MSRTPTEESLLVRAYAEAHGHTVQWARRERKKETAGWQSFLASRAAGGAPVAAAVNVLRTPMTELERAEFSKDAAWTTLQQALAAAQGYKGGDYATMSALNRAVREARATYEAAAKYEKQQSIEAMRWVPIGKVEGIRSALPQLSEVVQNWRTTIAGRLPAEMRPAFYRAFDESRPAWNEGVRRVDDYIQTLLPCPV